MLGTATYNVPGLILGALFLLFMAYLVVRAKLAQRGRSKRAGEYVAQETPPTLAPHAWQPASVSPSSALGLPDAQALAQMPALEQWFAGQAEKRVRIENARSTNVEGTTLTVFDTYAEQSNEGRTTVVHTVFGSFALRTNAPALQIDAQVGIGTYVIGNSQFSRMEFELDDFNRAFCVTGGDQHFGYSLIDGAMMRWLLAHPALQSLHVGGSQAVAVFTPTSGRAAGPAIDRDAVAAFVVGFVARIPSIVFSTWGSPPPA